MPSCIQRLRTVVTVEPVIFLYMSALFMFTQAFQELVITKVCWERFGSSSPVCVNPGEHKTEDEESRSSLVLLLYTAVLSVISIPPAMLLGSWSDQAGRRRLVLILPCVLSLAGGALVIVMSVEPSLGPFWVLGTAGISGMSGGTSSLFLSSFSYLADVTLSSTGASRTSRMAVAESMIFVGGTVGFLLGGLLMHRFGLLATFVAYCCCHALSIVYILVWLRDSAPPCPSTAPVPALRPCSQGDPDVMPAPSESTVLSHAKRSFRVVFRKRAGQERRKLHLLILCTFFNQLVAVGETGVSLLFLTYEPRAFTTELYGLFNAARMLLLGLSLLVLFPLLLRCVGEQMLAKLSALFRMAGCLTMAFSSNTWMVFLVAVVGAPAGINQAVVKSLSSAIVQPDEQGAMFSFCASVEALCIALGGLIFNGLYPLTLASFPGMPYIVMATLSLVFILTQ
ncbi:LOW QUALITY PROTEIN: proton-coupled folate transporter [Aplochiton taeniatus]